MSTSFPVVKRAMAHSAPSSNPREEAAPTPYDRPATPRLVTPLDLPCELLTRVTRCIIPDSPFLTRPSGSVPHFRIAAAMDGLRNWSQTCKPLHAVVANLRKDSDHLPFRQLAGRAEYEFRRRSEQARQASIARYGVDPVHWEGESLVLQLHASDEHDLARCRKELQEYADQVRTIYIRLGQSAIGASVDLLADGFAGCTGLDELSVFAEGPLPLALISAVVRLPASLKSLKLEGPALPAGLFDCLVAATASSQIESLVLEAASITPEDCAAMAQAAGHFKRLRFLGVHGAMVSRECCELLAAALPGFVLLESLQIGRNGGIDAAGALVLVAAARSGGKVTRLGLHNVEGKAAIVPVLEALQQYSGLKELAMTGLLDEASSLQPWSLLTGDASCLCALDLEDGGLNEQQMEGLATAMQSSARLQELRLAREQFTDKGALALARAIKSSTSLLRLTLDNCRLNATTQARSFSSGVARNRSLLELNVLLKPGPRKYADDVTDTFSAGVAGSPTLLHFGLSWEVRECLSQAKQQMKQNRMR